MMKRYRQWLRETRASYTPEKAAEERRGERLAYLCYRPLSFYLTPLFLALGWTADAVSVLQIVLALTLPLVAWSGPVAGPCGVVAIALLIQVLDCVDGNVARVTQRFSAAGVMMDGLCTLLFWTCYFVAIGVAAQLQPDTLVGRHGREVGLAVAVLMLAQRGIEDTFASTFDERVRWTPPVVENSRFAWAGKFLEQLLAFGGLLVAAAARKVEWFVAALALYQAGVFLLWVPRFGRALRSRMRPRGA